MEDSLQRLRMDAPATNDNGGSSLVHLTAIAVLGDLSYHTVYGRSRKRHTDSVRKESTNRLAYRERIRGMVLGLESGLRAELLPYPVLYSIFS